MREKMRENRTVPFRDTAQTFEELMLKVLTKTAISI